VSIEKRLKSLEARIPLRCRECGHELYCDTCEYGRSVREMATEELEAIILEAMRERLQKHGISFFRLIGCDLGLLTVEELRTLRTLLDNMSPYGGPYAHAESSPR
jgi:hypothetical protein